MDRRNTELRDSGNGSIDRKALRPDGGTATTGDDQFMEWLEQRIENAEESIERETNRRHTNISLGKLRAYNDVRKEYRELQLGPDGDFDE